jgi:DNA polymerase III delta prime subunit
MSELSKLILCEKYRPQTLKDLVFEGKDRILKDLEDPLAMPSYIFSSSRAGTGKTSLSKVIANMLNCDVLHVNGSKERGIDIVRNEIENFVSSMSYHESVKRCVIIEEASGFTKAGQESLKDVVEKYSKNAFFIFTCNDISKIIDPIRSRCITIDFSNPSKQTIIERLEFIVKQESLSNITKEDLVKLCDAKYPDIRSMIMSLQVGDKPKNDSYPSFVDDIKNKRIEKIYNEVYNNNFDIVDFNRWFFKYLFENYKVLGIEKCGKISLLLADVEKSYNLGINLPIVFIANIIEISKII